MPGSGTVVCDGALWPRYNQGASVYLTLRHWNCERGSRATRVGRQASDGRASCHPPDVMQSVEPRASVEAGMVKNSSQFCLRLLVPDEIEPGIQFALERPLAKDG